MSFGSGGKAATVVIDRDGFAVSHEILVISASAMALYAFGRSSQSKQQTVGDRHAS